MRRRPRVWAAWADLQHVFQKIKANTTTRKVIVIIKVGEV